MNKPIYTREQIINRACRSYGLENPITIAICEINETHPNDDRYTFIMETLYIYGSVGMGEGYTDDDIPLKFPEEDEDIADIYEDYEEFWDTKIREI